MTNSETITKIKSEIRNRLVKKVEEADLYYGQSSKSDTIEGEIIAYTDILSFVSGLKENDNWKPSERQLTKLYCIARGIPDDDDAEVLMEIYDQLKKL